MALQRLKEAAEKAKSTYPRGLAFGTVVGSRSPVGRRIWQRYWEKF